MNNEYTPCQLHPYIALQPVHSWASWVCAHWDSFWLVICEQGAVGFELWVIFEVKCGVSVASFLQNFLQEVGQLLEWGSTLHLHREALDSLHLTRLPAYVNTYSKLQGKLGR